MRGAGRRKEVEVFCGEVLRSVSSSGASVRRKVLAVSTLRREKLR